MQSTQIINFAKIFKITNYEEDNINTTNINICICYR